jgi:D-glycero-alpha-D-manno-heptose 1-phosphate guanylyltransferase
MFSAAMGNVTEAIILAGGLGTRLRDTVPDLPKCMAPVAGRPFLFHVINYLRSQGVERFIFSLGYRHEVIEEYLESNFASLDHTIVIESTPLGTGGAIQLACYAASSNTLVIANGDTLYKVDLESMEDVHLKLAAECTLALKPMKNIVRYGTVNTEGNKVTGFTEKQFREAGNINGGIYLLEKDQFLKKNWPEKFSFETEYLQKEGKFAASVQDNYFIDIGIPEDYKRADQELQPAFLDLARINKNWTLFLDRDGVINEDKVGSYIFNPDEFVFMEGTLQVFKRISELFGRIIVITNQRGVEKKLMTVEDLEAIHKKMIAGIKNTGGRIDHIYYCTALENRHPLRKPNPGMAFQAKKDFPEIDFSKTIMVGNNLSDMLFGKNAGLHTIFVKTTQPGIVLPHPDIDMAFDNLPDFANSLPSRG